MFKALLYRLMKAALSPALSRLAQAIEGAAEDVESRRRSPKLPPEPADSLNGRRRLAAK